MILCLKTIIHKAARLLSRVNLVFLCSFFFIPPQTGIRLQNGAGIPSDASAFPGLSDNSGIDSGLSFYENHSVLVIVPHEDDEICLMGGVFEQFLKHGSTVRVVFLTNGDFEGPEMGTVRINEAVRAAAVLGIPESNLIFLGYGDQWANGHHIYNAAGDEVLLSHCHLTETYGTEAHPAFRSHAPYTRNDLKQDLASVILTYLPDQIFCIDLDGHKDHKAASLFFEEVMGDLLRESSAYQPAVFKGFGYNTAWAAPADFYSENILSTKRPLSLSYSAEIPYYLWHQRIRFPIALSDAARLLQSAPTFRALRCYESQSADAKAAAVISGDRVFWFRPTTSLLYQAGITASSGNTDVLHDFKIVDLKEDITERFCFFSGHVWSPLPDDNIRRISVTLQKPSSISELILYDNNDPGSNILNMRIVFSDGSKLNTGELNKNGEPTVIRFAEKKGITSFTMTITSFEGDQPGLSEIEAYSTAPSAGISFIKLMNGDEDYMYDYWIDESGSESVRLYSYPNQVEIVEDNYQFSSSLNPDNVSVRGDEISISCGKGETYLLTAVSVRDPKLYDTVRISNPSPAKRLLARLLQEKEASRLAG